MTSTLFDVDEPRPTTTLGAPLLVVDGTNLAHRCFHASDRAKDPDVTARLMFTLIAAGVDRSRADHAVIAFDGPDAGAHRYALFPGYKSGRAEKDDTIRDVLKALPRLVADAGWAVHTSRGVEADDVLAHYATDLHARTVLLTADKDALGLLDHPNVAVLRVTNGGPKAWTWITAATLQDHAGVTAEQYALFTALKGDTSDAIPGVVGIGPVLATKLATAHTTVDAFLHDLEKRHGKATKTAIGTARTNGLLHNLPGVRSELELTLALTAPCPVHDAPARDVCYLPGKTPEARRPQAGSSSRRHRSRR